MQNKIKTLLIGLLSTPLWAQSEQLGGFFYGQMESPTGWEWQSPDSLAYNKQQPHAWFFSFNNIDEARRVLPENSSLWQTLDGQWAFHWSSNPSERPKDFYKTDYDISSWDCIDVPSNWGIVGLQKDGTFKYGIPLYSNQRVIFQHSVKVNDWKGGVMRTPPQDWVTYKDRNEVGSYRRNFTLPTSWDGKNVYINFDGVDSFFYLYINGHYVGFSKNSRNLAQFDITPYLNKKGEENMVAVEVYRNSDASFLESQDMLRLPGIFRSVSLTAKPQIQVRDIQAIPDYDVTYTNASLQIKAEVRNLSEKKQKGLVLSYTLYENKLYSDENTLVPNVSATVPVSELLKGATTTASVTLQAGTAVKPWNAEAPYRYVLVGQLLDKKGNALETFSTTVGFRKIEIKETAAEQDEFGLKGRYYYLNGKPIKMKGVNRHETSADCGHAITREHMEKEVMMMKRANINHVRNSHYPDAPYWYYLCDKYGIYLEDEANIESHEYYYGDASLSHVKEFRNAHVARNVEMVRANVNHPSISIWSLGNEAGPGKNFVECYNAIKQIDLSRPIQYERNNDIVDMGSNQYPSIAWVQGAVTGKYDIKYPYHISEYAHSMGNAVGNLIDYWNAIESTNFFIGGAIWEWVDHGIYSYTPNGTRYIAYGGDHGVKPNDGMFCLDGVMQADLSPKPQYYEVKKVYQNVGIKALDMKQGKIEIFNKNYFESFKNFQVVWSLWEDGKCIKSGQTLQGDICTLAPRQHKVFTLNYDYAKLNPKKEYFVKVQFLQKDDTPWAKKDYVQMEEQLLVREATEAAPSLSNIATSDTKIEKSTDGDLTILKGKDFEAKFDSKTGSLYALSYNNQPVFLDGNGPKLDAFRAPTDNDDGIGFPKAWWQNGLYDLQHKALSSNITMQKDGSVQLCYTVESKGKEGSQQTYHNTDREKGQTYSFEVGKHEIGEDGLTFITNQIYTVYPDGSIELQSAISSSSTSVVLPRIGYSMQLPTDINQISYYGRGPINNYNDRKTSQNIEIYSGKVGENDILLANPQAMGNREEVRWCSLGKEKGLQVYFISDSVMSCSALPWSQRELTLAAHPHELPQSNGVYLHLDAKVTGLGGASCGQGGPFVSDQVRSNSYNFGFIIRKGNEDLHVSKVSSDSEKPICVEHSRTGIVKLSTAKKGRTIMYSINNAKKGMPYTQPIDMREGGTIKAWYKEVPTISITMTYDKIESVPLDVVYVSSQESGEGDATNLVDGDAETIWHTMYSITLAKYPHWVDFDAGETKLMKGFTLLPRQSGRNGWIKNYEIYVSQDGKEWGQPIAQGVFSNNADLKKVLFEKPVKARYIRFRALSEQNGNDYASAAEFSLIAD